MTTKKSLCIALHAAIEDEHKATSMYFKLALDKGLNSEQSVMLMSIRSEEAKHLKEISKLYQHLGCTVEKTDMLLEKNQHMLPHEEKIRRAKLFASQF